MPEFLLPDLGEGLTEAEVVRWLVEVGDEIVVDQPVVEVETAKASVEVPSPFAGVITARHGEPGQTLAVGAPLITVAAAGGFTEPGVVTAGEGSGNVLIGYGTPERRSSRRRRSGATTAVVDAPAAPVVISPLVRKIARDNGIDLTHLTGTGPQGIIRRADVELAMTERAAVVPAPRDGAQDRRIPLRGLRKAIADKLTTSRREIPEATVWVDADATGLLAARAAINERDPDHPVSLLSLFARFAVAGLRRYPELNARVEGDEIVVLGAVHLGFAAQTDRGLVVPVVRDAGRLSTRALAEGIAARTAAARDGSLPPAELTGGTFTVNNYGVFGVDGSAAIINHPEAAILGIGRIIERPWVVAGEVVPRTICQLTLTFDHRVCDGATAGGFLRFVADCTESPLSALGEL
ncbi:dihydrolipoamide acetyltransferase family protein [Amycolatopsis pithecellobii]|uniref:Dihydrolipoamide acetyltransferase component of pyruvate dehydrogenase complex n=1 Tax=Amycolatopsis pithecellobii TaxID=664692 RepID=A0A6N7Z2Z0_9PSEU|nr:dihydrolipoamide acetyltransferase family protein [Amycolatopsis pithecellobii]MTD54370.1 2-oxo acid dehydrogenase subunit E2 [Amycolatopsis pithecellobii]